MDPRPEPRVTPEMALPEERLPGCLICAMRERDPRLLRLEIHRGTLALVSLYPHPYNPGHLLVAPLRHLTDFRELTREELLELHRLQGLALDALASSYHPRGFNLGFRLGRPGPEEHLHYQVIPRHNNEIGLVELTSQGTRCLVEDPLETVARLRQAFSTALEQRP